MNQEQQANLERIRIQAYSLFDFLKALEQRIIEGYRVSDKSGDFPTGFVNYYTCQLVKVAEPMLGDVPVLYTEDKRGSFVEPQVSQQTQDANIASIVNIKTDSEDESAKTDTPKVTKAKGAKVK